MTGYASWTMKHPAALPLQPAARDRLERYLDLLYEVGASHNLTRVPRQDAWQRHIEESLSLLPLHHWSADEVILDLGSGGGVPGIPLAIAVPQVRVLLLERNLTKAAFLERCRVELGLDQVEVVARNAEEVVREKPHPRVDILVSRAAAPPARLIPLTAPFLNSSGLALLMVGQSVRISLDLRTLCRRHHLTDPEIMDTGLTRILTVRKSP